MTKLDPQLEFLVHGGLAQLASTGDPVAALNRFGVEHVPETELAGEGAAEALNAADVTVLVQTSGEPDVLASTGLRIRSRAGDVVTGTIALSALDTLADLAEVERVEAARAMHLELDLSVPEARVDLVHTGPPGRRGAGVIVGICDSGCDFTHPSFRRADGSSRILFIWDQGLAPRPGENSPPGFGYGVEYTNAQINTALNGPAPFDVVRHHDRGGHGTHVTGIAAGDGSAPGQGRPGGTFVGVAPEADIIVVANASNGAEGLGTSANTLDAVNYIFQQAGTLARPCVVNMSLGDNLGPHDGTSLLERGLDNLLGGPGRGFVKSAGNAGSSRCHAEGTVLAGATQDVRFNQPAGDSSPNQIDVWYRGGDTFRVSVIDPAGNAVGPVAAGAVGSAALPGGNNVRIDHRASDPVNGDKRVFITFTPGAAGDMQSGNWIIRLVSTASPAGGRFDAWIQRGFVVPGFLPPHESPARTISTPGTAREVITAGNYISRGAGVGSLATTSSRGPTRDGRAAPTVAAPGMTIYSADGESSSGDPYQPMWGTSMAAPHVTGTIALMLQKDPSRTQEQLRHCLESTSRSDAQTGPVPNTAWGAGKLDANAAVHCVPGPLVRSVVQPCLPPVSVPRTACPVSVPRISCTASVPAVTCPPVSVALPCPSVPAVTCGVPSVVGSCLSVAVVCPTVVGCPSVAGCPSLVGCPSLAGGCASVAGGCLPGGQPVPEGHVPPPLPGAWEEGRPDAGTGVEAPAQGYYEYDESWFDDRAQ